MPDSIFKGLFDTDMTSVISVSDFLLCTGVSLCIGLILAFAFMYHSRYTKSFIMTLAFFGNITGIGWGTLVMAVLNGTIIGLFSKMLDKIFNFQPTFNRFAALFVLQSINKKTEFKE